MWLAWLPDRALHVDACPMRGIIFETAANGSDSYQGTAFLARRAHNVLRPVAPAGRGAPGAGLRPLRLSPWSVGGCLVMCAFFSTLRCPRRVAWRVAFRGRRFAIARHAQREHCCVVLRCVVAGQRAALVAVTLSICRWRSLGSVWCRYVLCGSGRGFEAVVFRRVFAAAE